LESPAFTRDFPQIKQKEEKDKMNTYWKITDEVSVDHMFEVASGLAKWERLSGSEEEYEAFLWLEKQYKEYGYETRLIKHDAYISLPVSCTFAVNGKEIHAQTHSMVPSKHAEGELVYCKNIGEIRSMDCAGKLILMKGRAVYEPVAAAEGKGALGVVFIQDGVIRECIPSASWGSPAPSDWKYFPSIPSASIVDDDGNVLLERLEAGEVLKASLTTVTDTSWRKIPLLIADLKAPVDTEQFVMFTGHVDSWYYGAIDNGTANAAQMEVARLAALHKDELKRNFRIVHYSGHSHGRYAGSAWYADNFWEELHANCAVNVNADSLGGRNAMDIIHSIIMPETKDLAVEIVRRQTGETFEGVRCGRLGDQSFWNVGVSSAFASFSRQKKKQLPDGTMGLDRGNAELGSWWHTPADLPEYIDKDNLLRDGRIFAEYVMTFLTEPVLPLNFRRTTAEITEKLKAWDAMAGEEFDLSYSVKKAEKLEKLCESFYEAELPAKVKNQVILKLARILVPLDFTRGDIYSNEPARAIDAVPSLSLIKELVKPETAPEMKMSMKVELRRKTNYVNDSLNRAASLLASCMR